MANMCLYEPIHGEYPDCDANCEDCSYYYIDEVREIMKQWKQEAKVDTPILTEYDYKRQKFVIYTTKPGYLIGFHGKTYYKYRDLLNDKLRSHLSIHDKDADEDKLIEFIECDDWV